MNGPYTLNPEVVFKRLQDRMVLVHVESNQIFELNETAARVWELLGESVHGDELITRLSDEFDTDIESLRTEVEALISDLVAEALIKV